MRKRCTAVIADHHSNKTQLNPVKNSLKSYSTGAFGIIVGNFMWMKFSWTYSQRRMAGSMISLLLLIMVSACSMEAEKLPEKEIKVIDFSGLEPYIHKDNDTTYVINFWATWCKPCVEEMPAFLKLDSLYRYEKFKLILVSLDFPNKLESHVKPYVEKNNIQAEVVLLNDPDANAWINKVDSSWSGAIPVTLIYNSGLREFYEKTFEFEELKEIVESKLHTK